MIIAVDGPAAAGKGTIARALADEQALAQADLILALEPVDLWGLTNDVRDLIGRPNVRLNRQANLKIVHIGTESLLVKANYGEVQRFASAELSIAGDAEATMEYQFAWRAD